VGFDLSFLVLEFPYILELEDLEVTVGNDDVGAFLVVVWTMVVEETDRLSRCNGFEVVVA
jgi:hypothetical protein